MCEIPKGFSRGVGRVESRFLAFHAFHTPAFPWLVFGRRRNLNFNADHMIKFDDLESLASSITILKASESRRLASSRMNANLSSDGAISGESKGWLVYAWCLPTFLGIAAFLLAFPIDRQIPFWPHANLAEVFGAWFLLVAPTATTLAIVTFTKQARRGLSNRTPKWILVVVVTLSILLNLLVLIGLYAASF